MRSPPMVGVPCFSTIWRCGPSSRIGWPLPCMDFSFRMNHGPIRKQITIAVTTAPPLRNVRYRKTFSIR